MKKQLISFLLLLFGTHACKLEVDPETEGERVGKLYCNCMKKQLAHNDFFHATTFCTAKAAIKSDLYLVDQTNLAFSDSVNVDNLLTLKSREMWKAYWKYIHINCCKEIGVHDCENNPFILNSDK